MRGPPTGLRSAAAAQSSNTQHWSQRRCLPSLPGVGTLPLMGALLACPCSGARVQPPLECVFLPNTQLFDPGSKHTKPPHDAADEDACCRVCMADASCVGAVLYGRSCYPKTAVLPRVNQTGVTACVRTK